MSKSQSSYLKIVMGCMFSGKTTHLINTAKKFDDVLIINHISDTRYSSEMLSTHDEIKIPCLFLEKLFDVPKNINARYIFINEAQFFTDLYDFVVQCLAENKSIFVYGLDGDYKQKPIGEILNLIPLCDSCEKLTAKCELCGEPAIFSKMICSEDAVVGQILVGQKESYIPTCRLCLHAH